MPERIQRKRSRGWRMPEGAVYVGRPTRFGNPAVVGQDIHCTFVNADGLLEDGWALTITPEIAVTFFEQIMESRLTPIEGEHPDDRAYRDEWVTAVASLRGKDLVCWCPLDAPCHADVLLRIANEARS